MKLVNIYYINVQHNAQITESPKETIDQYHFIAEHKRIKPEEIFSYKVFSLNWKRATPEAAVKTII